VAVINETMARRYWTDGAVGRTFRLAFDREAKPYTIIGVVADHRLHAVAERPAPYLHFSAAQNPATYNHVVARTAGDDTELLAALRRELLSLEPGLVFLGSNTMEANLAASLLPDRVSAMLAAGFGALGTLLAAIGLYGVIAYSVARRTREIGIRVALGAHPGGVLRLILAQGFGLAGVGAAIGAVLAAGAALALQGVIYGVGAADPVAWLTALSVMFLAVFLANIIPARRAIRIDPVTALRTE
jgi:predicted lysophospholipase L1 biosynthesis ABC-type transport system permease subunit